MNRLPRWRGFNLLPFYETTSDCTPLEEDFRWIADWGFDFVRLPLNYLLWLVDDTDPYKVHPRVLERLDRAVELGRRFNLHVNLSFHRAPGYSVHPERKEAFNLWKDAEALDAFCHHWSLLTERYKGIPNDALSFNLLNEPPHPVPMLGFKVKDYVRVTKAVTATIRGIDRHRLLIADGVSYGDTPVPELQKVGIAQSCRGYAPYKLTHYRAPWADKRSSFPTPTWPGGRHNGRAWNRQDLEAHYRPWTDLMAQGVGVHCGECGVYNRTPHAVVVAWMTDLLDTLKAKHIGWALWNFRGPFGVLNSERTDVDYEDWYGHKLDRRLLNVLQAA